MSVTLPCEKRSKFPKSEKTLQLSHKQWHLTLQFVSKDWECSKSKCLNAQCTSIQRALVVVTVSCWWISTTPFTRLDRTSSRLIAPSNVDTGQCEQAMQNLKLECEQYNHDCIIRQSKNFQQHPVEILQEDIDIGGKKQQTADPRHEICQKILRLQFWRQKKHDKKGNSRHCCTMSTPSLSVLAWFMFHSAPKLSREIAEGGTRETCTRLAGCMPPLLPRLYTPLLPTSYRLPLHSLVLLYTPTVWSLLQYTSTYAPATILLLLYCYITALLSPTQLALQPDKWHGTAQQAPRQGHPSLPPSSLTFQGSYIPLSSLSSLNFQSRGRPQLPPSSLSFPG